MITKLKSKIALEKVKSLGGKTPFYNEIFGIERNYGLVEVWHQTFNENSQNKTIKQTYYEKKQRSYACLPCQCMG